jgi:putative transposase
VLNRSAGRRPIFRADADFVAFERIMLEAHRRFPIPILAWCILHNHWHFAVFPDENHDGRVTEFFRWLTHTHAMRWRVAHHTVGDGPLYQGRFKSFLVEEDDRYLFAILRYVERNALSAGIVRRAERWRWSSLWTRLHGTPEMRALLAPWPIERPRNWVAQVNEPLTERELAHLRMSVAKQRPFGSDSWAERTAARFGLSHTLRDRGRPAATLNESNLKEKGDTEK